MAFNNDFANKLTVSLAGLNVLAVGQFEGNLWEGNSKVRMGIFLDERADERQREALQMIFGGRAGGWPGVFANFIGEVRGLEFARIDFEIASDLAYWRAEVPGKVVARAEALTGPTSLPGKRVQVHNPPGAEVGPGAIATQGKTITYLRHLASNSSGPAAPASTWNSTGRARIRVRIVVCPRLLQL